jgi:hypothetical protein
MLIRPGFDSDKALALHGWSGPFGVDAAGTKTGLRITRKDFTES